MINFSSDLSRIHLMLGLTVNRSEVHDLPPFFAALSYDSFDRTVNFSFEKLEDRTDKPDVLRCLLHFIIGN